MANLRVDKITSTETFDKTGSVQFDGSNDDLSVGSAGDFNYLHNGAASFTAEFWVYPQLVNSRQSIFSTGGNSSSTGFTVRIMSSGDYGSSNGYLVAAQTSKSSDGNYLYWDSESTTLSANTWYHIATVYDHTYNTLKIYVNGKLTNSGHSRTYGTFSSHSTSNSSYALNVGQEPYGNTMHLKGHLSNLRILNGVKLYTSNFKPPMRELEVVPGTVLLACQSKTDATLEKTGKTITANGNAVASELTPGILTPIVKSGGGSAITGSVEFDGTGDYLSVQSSTDFDFGTGDFTIELYANLGNLTSRNIFARNDSNPSNTGILLWQNGSSQLQWYSSVGNTTGVITVTTPLTLHEWDHIAVSRESNTTRLFANGVLIGSTSDSTDISGDSALIVGSTFAGDGYYLKGFISNLRLVKGTALYTDDFIPPTRELKNVPGTVLLCCQDENSVTTEVTGKTITSNGDPAPSNFTPQVGDDRQVTFEGVTKIDTDAHFYLPTGDTASREATGTYNAGTRGIFGGGFSTPTTHHDTIQYINIASLGNAVDAGNLTESRYGNAALASDTRAVWAGGVNPSPAVYNTIDAVEIMSTGNAFDFGDLYANVYYPGGVSNRTRGIYAGGYNPADAPSGFQNNIGYITISSKGDSQDFGDLITAKNSYSTFGSPTRGCFAGGATPSRINTIEYVTIASTGNGQDFGDLTAARNYGGGCGSAIRGLVGGGQTPTTVNTIDYVTISAMGSAADFGDLTSVRAEIGSCSSATRGIFAGAWSPTKVNVIDYVTIQTTANAKDFGDLVNIGVMQECGTSNGHGGLG